MTDHNQSRSRVTKQTFSHEIRFSSSASVASINVDPVNSTSFFGSQVSNMANLYNEFRCTSIKVTVYPNIVTNNDTGANATSLYMGYTPVPPASSPASATDICQLSDVFIYTSGMSYPSSFVIGKKSLLGLRLLKWYHQDTTPNTVTDMQGRIFYVAAGTNSTSWVQQWLVQSTWEFRAPVPFGEYLKKHALPSVDSKEQLPPPGVVPPPSTTVEEDPSQPSTIFTPSQLFALDLLVKQRQK